MSSSFYVCLKKYSQLLVNRIGGRWKPMQAAIAYYGMLKKREFLGKLRTSKNGELPPAAPFDFASCNNGDQQLPCFDFGT